jgi:hypothetical protein
MYQRLQAYYEIVNGVISQNSIKYVYRYATEGTTPEPCSGGELFSVAVQPNQLDGSMPTPKALSALSIPR